jgi:hypothetical protein
LRPVEAAQQVIAITVSQHNSTISHRTEADGSQHRRGAQAGGCTAVARSLPRRWSIWQRSGGPSSAARGFAVP